CKTNSFRKPRKKARKKDGSARAAEPAITPSNLEFVQIVGNASNVVNVIDEPIARKTPSPNPFWPTETVQSVKVGKKRRMTRDLELASEPETEPSMMEVIQGMKAMMVTMQKSIEALAKENRELAEANEAKHDVVLRNMYRQTAAINELVAISRPKAGLLPKGDFSLSPIGTEKELREFNALLGSASVYKTKTNLNEGTSDAAAESLVNEDFAGIERFFE
uniref:Uncharacterized protein n=1 Tax=Anopheles atroparvus TaxID=41427 RepID=A0A182IYL9_ANOAO